MINYLNVTPLPKDRTFFAKRLEFDCQTKCFDRFATSQSIVSQTCFFFRKAVTVLKFFINITKQILFVEQRSVTWSNGETLLAGKSQILHQQCLIVWLEPKKLLSTNCMLLSVPYKWLIFQIFLISFLEVVVHSIRP